MTTVVKLFGRRVRLALATPPPVYVLVPVSPKLVDLYRLENHELTAFVDHAHLDAAPLAQGIREAAALELCTERWPVMRAAACFDPLHVTWWAAWRFKPPTRKQREENRFGGSGRFLRIDGLRGAFIYNGYASCGLAERLTEERRLRERWRAEVGHAPMTIDTVDLVPVRSAR